MTLKSIREYLHSFYFKIKNHIIKYPYLKYLIIFVLFIVIIATFGFYLGISNSNKNYTINNFEKALINNNAKNISKYLVFNDNNIKVTEDNIRPFLEYLNSGDNRKKSLIDSLKTSETQGNGEMAKMRFIKKGLFKHWKIELQPVYISFSTSFKDSKVFINNRLYATSNKDGYSEKLGPFIPGKYDVKVLLSNEFGSSEVDKPIQLLYGLVPFSLSPPALKLTIQSNFTDSEVFINEKSTNLTVNKFKNIGPVPMNSQSYVYAKKNFPWGEVISDKKNITDLPEIRLDINPLTEDLRKSLEEIYKEFYESFFVALNKNDISLIKHSSEKIVKPIFNKYKNSALIIKDSYKMKNIQWEQNAIAIKMENGLFKSNAVVNLEYDKQKNLWGFPLLSRPESLSFQSILSYDEKNNTWVVSEINEISK